MFGEFGEGGRGYVCMRTGGRGVRGEAGGRCEEEKHVERIGDECEG